VRTPGAERTERGGRQEAEELGTGGKEQPFFLPQPSFMATTEEEWNAGVAFLLFFLSFSVISLVRRTSS